MGRKRKPVDPRKGISVYYRDGKYYCQYKSNGYDTIDGAKREADNIEVLRSENDPRKKHGV